MRRDHVTPDDERLWRHALRAYVAGVFRGRFPRARSVVASYDDLNEEWVVVVDGALWSQLVGSDDGEFRLRRRGVRTPVRFPIPERL